MYNQQRLKKVALMLMMSMLCLISFAQERQVQGIVKDKSGEPMIGVNVLVKGTTNGTITGVDGDFTLSGVKKSDILSFTYIGFKNKELKYEGEKLLNVVLEEDSELLDEVVVIGYGTVNKRDLTGSVASVSSQDIASIPVSSASEALTGKMAGVNITTTEGSPDADIKIRIRGGGSLSQDNSPLYIVDGFPVSSISDIAPSEIQSIDVLKDASATAIYGSRGANGVVIITTKRGEKGNEKVEFSANFTFSKIAKRMDVLDAFTYANYQNEQVLNDYKYSNKPYGKLPYPGAWEYPALPGGGNDTSAGKYLPAPEDFLRPGDYVDEYGNISYVGVADWQDLIYQNGFSQEYNISVSGGSDKGWHSFSGNFLKQDGIIKNSGFTRYSLRSNIGR